MSVCRVSCLSVSAIPWTNATITRTSTIELHAFLRRRLLGDAPLASAPLLTYKSRFVERDLQSTSAISKFTCSSPITWPSPVARSTSRPLTSTSSAPASPMPDARPSPCGEIYVSTTHCYLQSTYIADVGLYRQPQSHALLRASLYSSRSHGMHLDEHQIAPLPSTLVTCFASRFATRPHRTGCTSVHLYRQF